MSSKLTVGADPEFFLMNDQGIIVSAHNLLPGTKQNPHRLTHGAVQVDGTAAEFNIDPASSDEEFVHNIRHTLNEIQKLVPKHNFVITAHVIYDPAYFKKLPKSAVELGCIPDFNAYTMDVNPMPSNYGSMRTAGGHVHIGGEAISSDDHNGYEHRVLCSRLAKNLDCTIGLYSVDYDADQKRRKMYGLAGTFRPKPYGIEYRTPSNFWINSSRHMSSIYNLAIYGVEDYLEKGTSCKFMQERPEIIQRKINRQ